MSRPNFIESAAGFDAFVVLESTPETIFLEFKGDLPGGWKSPEDRQELSTMRKHGGDPLREARIEQARDLAQFANTSGGTLLYGVRERELANGQCVATEVVSLEELDRRREWIEESARRFLVPNTLGMRIHAFEVRGAHLLAVNVPPSRSPIAIWDAQRGTIEFIRRTNHGKQNMDPDNAVRFMLDRSRAARITLDRVVDELKVLQVNTIQVDLVGAVWTRRPGERVAPASVNVYLVQLDEHEFEISVDEHVLRVPYGLVREAWRTTMKRMGLMLEARVVLEQRGATYAMLDLLG